MPPDVPARILRELFRRSSDMFCMHALDGRILAVNPAICRILGYSEEQLTSMNLRDLLTPEVAPRFDEYQAAISLRGMASGKMNVLTAGGEERVWEYENILTADGQPVVCGMGRDVTSAEESRRMLQSSEWHFRLLAENNPDVIMILGVDGAVRYHSPSAVRALQCGPNVIQGERLTDFVAEEDRGTLESAIARIVDGGAAERIELSLIRHPGLRRSFEIILSPLVQRKQVEGVLLNARDVTERKLLEQQLEQANRVNSLGRLAATIAHEFNNVLMGMMPFAELLRRPETSSELITRSTAHILQSIHRGKRVALDVLRFTQPAEPTVDYVPLDAWWENFQQEARGRLANRIRLEAFIEPVAVAADSLQLSQLFTNLITNAVDAMPDAGRLTVHARAVAAGGVFPFGVVPDADRFVHISVEDTGTGIEPELLRHVFDPLFTTKRNGGTGLGLAVTHQIVTRHGGSIFVESTLGIGTTFHIFLPRGEQPEAAREGPAKKEQIQRLNLQLLLVEDEPLIADGLTEQLRMEGFAVRVATTGAEALADSGQPPCDLVVLDIGLPDMDGREVASRLRQSRPNLPIILATGHGNSKLVGSDARMRLLRKPFRVAELTACIADLISREDL
jgi:two-component system cell cycle sensor histidine kinase/response regulator CckA